MQLTWLLPVFFLLCLGARHAGAQDIESLRAGVVKVRAQEPKRTGTGIVVSVTADRVLILTAAHVVEGDPEPTVEFYADRGSRIQAEVSKLEAADPRGLAILRVAKRKLPDGINALALSMAKIPDGADVKVIGFPMGGADWSIVNGSISGRSGRDLTLDGSIKEGNSGGPVLKGTQVVAIVTQTTDFARATPASAVAELLANWGITLATAGATGTEMGFRVVELMVRADPMDYKGKCPVKINFSGRISAVGGKGIVSYRWARDDGASAPIQTLNFTGAGTQNIQGAWTLGAPGKSFSGWQSIKVIEPMEMESGKAPFKIHCDAGQAEDGADAPPDTCIQGYVWREAFSGDHACVTPGVRAQATFDNSQAAARKQFGGGADGPDTCRFGFVWREASPEDHVCVRPETRAQTWRDNELAPARVRRP